MRIHLLNNFSNISQKNIFKIGIGMLSIFTLSISFYYLFPEAWNTDSGFFPDGWQGFATGADGYYYAYQIREFLARGYFPSPEVSPVLYFMAFLASILGNVVASNKFAAILIKVAFVFPAFSIGRSLFNPRAGFLFAVLLVCSSFINYFAYQYIKNFGALFFFLCFLAVFIKFLQNREFKKIFTKYTLSLALFLVLAFLSHKTTAFLSLLTIGVYLLYKYINKIYIIIAVVGVLFVVLFLAGLFLPNSIYLGDLLRFEGYFSGSFSCAACEYIARVEPWHKVETIFFLFSFPVFLYLFFKIKRNTNSEKKISTSTDISINIKPQFLKQKEQNIIAIIMGLMFLIAINPLGGSIDNDMTYRLFILLFIPGAFFLTAILDTGIDTIQSFLQNVNNIFLKKYSRVVFMTFLVILSFVVLANQVVSAKRFNKSTLHDYKLYSQLIPFMDDLPQNSLLVIHQGFDYFYWYYTGKKAFHFMPEKKHEDRPLYRLAWGIPRNGFTRVIENSAHADQLSFVKYLPGNYILLKEETWRHYLGSLAPEEKEKHRNWRNPHTYRKEYLLRNQKFRTKETVSPK
ncbi:MAG: hypothetical protein ABUK01_16980 [Leptospirales bacterium]